MAQLQAAIKADEALIEAAKVQLSYTRLTSPIDGVVGIRQVDVGNIIHPTDSERPRRRHADRADLADLHASGDDSAANPAAAGKTKRPLTVLAYSQDDTIELDEGTLGLVNNEILQTTGSIQLKANFPNKAHRLWPGELVNARLLVDTRHDGLTVPASVVQQGPKGAYAYVINPDNTVGDPPGQRSRRSATARR